MMATTAVTYRKYWNLHDEHHTTHMIPQVAGHFLQPDLPVDGRPVQDVKIELVLGASHPPSRGVRIPPA
jgi:hypothetical protein